MNVSRLDSRDLFYSVSLEDGISSAEEEIQVDPIRELLFVARQLNQKLGSLERRVAELEGVKSFGKGSYSKNEIAKLHKFYAAMDLEKEVKLDWNTYRKETSMATSARFGVVVPTSAGTAAATLGGVGATVGATGGSFVLPVVGTIGGAAILGGVGVAVGLIAGSIFGIGTALGCTAIDYNGWKAIKIYHAYRDAIMAKLLEEEQLKQYRDSLNGKLFWEPYLVALGNAEAEYANRREVDDLREQIFGEKEIPRSIYRGSLETVSFSVGKEKADREYHKEQYKTLKEVIKKHKFALKGKFPLISKALDLISETYHPKYFGYDPDSIKKPDTKTPFRGFCSFKHYPTKKKVIAVDQIDQETFNNCSQIQQKSDDPPVNVPAAARNCLLSCVGL